MDTPVTLRQFLEITGNSLIEPWLCTVYISEYDEDYKGYFSQSIQFQSNKGYKDYYLQDIKNLEPYMDYEIYGFDQEFYYGELDSQVIWLRKINKETQYKWNN